LSDKGKRIANIISRHAKFSRVNPRLEINLRYIEEVFQELNFKLEELNHDVLRNRKIDFTVLTKK